MWDDLKQTAFKAYLITKDSLWGNISTLRSDDNQHQPYLRQQAWTQLTSQITSISLILGLLGPYSPFSEIEQGWEEGQYQENIDNEQFAEFINFTLAFLLSSAAGSQLGNKLGQGLYSVWTGLVTQGSAWSYEDRPLHDNTILKILNEIKRHFINHITYEENKKALEQNDEDTKKQQSDDHHIIDIESQSKSTHHKARQIDELFDISELRDYMLSQLKWPPSQLAWDEKTDLKENDTLTVTPDHIQQKQQHLKQLTSNDYPQLYQFIEMFTSPQQYAHLEQGLFALQQFIIDKKHDCHKKYSYDRWEKYQDCLQQYGDIISPIKAVINHAHKIEALLKQFNHKLDQLAHYQRQAENEFNESLSNSRPKLQAKLTVKELISDIIETMSRKPRSKTFLADYYDPVQQDKKYFEAIQAELDKIDPYKPEFTQQFVEKVKQACDRINDSILTRLEAEQTKLQPLKAFEEQLHPVIKWLQETFSDHSQKEETPIEPYQLGQSSAQDYLERRYPDPSTRSRQQLNQDMNQFFSGFSDIIHPEMQRLTHKESSHKMLQRPVTNRK